MIWSRQIPIVCVCFLLACSDGTAPDPDRICSAPLLVSVSRSTLPLVSWSGGCRVNQFSIHTAEPEPSLAWVVFSPTGVNALRPPVQYGVLPTGAQQLPDNPQPLTPGTTYIIDVFVADTITHIPMLVGSDTIVP